MNRILLNLLFILTALQLTSCNGILGNELENEKETETSSSVYLEIQSRLLSGTTAPITLNYSGSSTGEDSCEFYLGDTKIEIKKGGAQMGSDSVVIPKDMKGSFMPSVKIGGVMHEIISTPQTNIEIYQWMEDVLPGTAFRADVSTGSTLVTQPIRDESDQLINTTYKSYMMQRGRAPEVVKFYDVKGREVPGAFEYLKNLTDHFFVARLWNPSKIESDLYFDIDNYTARYGTLRDQSYVIVDKRSGNIIRLYKNGYDIDVPCFQWMGGNKFCLLPSGHNGEYSTSKLLRFEVPEYMCQPFSKDEAKDSFFFSIELEEVPYQNNLDIANSGDGHWIASSWDNVYFNRDRILKAGQLSNTSFCNDGVAQNQTVFVSYAEGGLYYICEHRGFNAPLYIHALSGNNSHYSNKANNRFNIYQYADHTYLRAISTRSQDELVSLKITKDEIIEMSQSGTIVEPDYNNMICDNYPMISIYDYLLDHSLDVLYRRTIANRNDDQKIFTSADALGEMNKFSASRTGCSFIVESYENNSMQYQIYDVGSAGIVAQMGALSTHGIDQIFMCRLRD